LEGSTLGDRAVKTETGMRVIAVRRPGEQPTGKHTTGWELSPGPETALTVGDVLIAKGTRSGAERLTALVAE
ncbi:MAG: TrkA C-terminal domain-containing protein, partial [archaeon]